MMIAFINKIIYTKYWETWIENPIEDYFNENKKTVRLIISEKKGNIIRKTPKNYGEDGYFHYALIRGYNCQGRCQYCYLQSYLKSKDIVIFKNTSYIIDFLDNFLKKFFETYPKSKIIIYDGDFYDSLGFGLLKHNLDQLENIITFLSNYDNVYLEIRTKQIINNFSIYDRLFKNKNLIVSVTLSPNFIINNFEKGTSDFDTRINFLKYVSNKSYIGLRFDPIIFLSKEQYDRDYIEMFKLIKSLNLPNIFNIGVGTLRLKENLYKKLKKSQSLLVENLILENGFYRYESNIRKYIYETLYNYFGKFYICMD